MKQQSGKREYGLYDTFSEKIKLPIEKFPLNIVCTISDAIKPFIKAIGNVFKGKPKNNNQNNS